MYKGVMMQEWVGEKGGSKCMSHFVVYLLV
jgi:hypothetical protein